MADFIELNDALQQRKILLNLKEVTFIQPSEKSGGKTTIIHFTSSTYAADRIVEVAENYDTIKDLIGKSGHF